RDDRPLPERYAFEGEDRSLADLLRASETTGLLVAHGGAILHEAYFQGYDERSLATSFSVAKSFTSALVGIALERGQIRSFDDAISDYVPEFVGSGYEGVAIRDVLTMSSGIACDEDYARLGSDVMRLPLRLFVLRQPVVDVLRRLPREREPGALQSYASSDAQALGLLLARATGTTVAGLLFLDAGRRDHRQVVPEAWVAASVRPGATTMAPDAAFGAGFGYGYQWWVPEGDEGDFLAMGIWGQFVYVHPGHRVVIVKTSTDPDYAGRERETVAAFRAIAAALAGGGS
ncbi:MAG: beta-lactamase family protein, partial [Trueperaceae bacterium]|nr:beta-lactamase family protein [Trueperaceae bacterium]